MCKRFLFSEAGAVTTDWMVLTAATVTLALVVGLTVSTPADGLAATIGNQLESTSPAEM